MKVITPVFLLLLWQFSHAFLLLQRPHRRGKTRLFAIRLNKVLAKTHSRRQADRLIQEGRVSVNDQISYGCMVDSGDVVKLDGIPVAGWEPLLLGNTDTTTDEYEYIKYWKPTGVVCTTDRRIKGNIIDSITRKSNYQPNCRIYPVGRLDKDSSGLILLTSDGRLPNASLRKSQKQPKVYRVQVDAPLTQDALKHLATGVVITTEAKYDRTTKTVTAKTLPCRVHPLEPTVCEITLTEGRNRQIRKMMEAVGYNVLELHRLSFGEIDLSNLDKEGDWKSLSGKEMDWIRSLLRNAQHSDDRVKEA